LQGREVRRAPAQYDRTDEEPVLVDKVQLDESGCEASAADGQVPTCLLLSLATSSATPSLTSLVLPSTFSSVFENTIFGMSFQMRANSSSCSAADGFSSAVSQYVIAS
jgi:hypothetical protein